MTSEVDRFVQDEEGMRLFQQERLILEVTELLQTVMKEKKIRRSQLAKSLGRTKGRITQLLDGAENLTLRTVADAFTAMGKMLCLRTRDIKIRENSYDALMPSLTYVTHANLSPKWQPSGHGTSDEVALAG